MDGRFSPIVDVTDVLPQVTKFTLTGFTIQSLHGPQTIHITTIKITTAYYSLPCQVSFVSRLGVIVVFVSRKKYLNKSK
jgi:hypothetical protein